MGRTAQEIHNRSLAKGLKKARLLKGLTRHELAARLGVSYKSIEKYENGREFLSEEVVARVLNALNISLAQLEKVRKGKTLRSINDRKKTVLTNQERRSYKKIITKECKTLRALRRMKDISQDEASRLCGYSRPTIGHIENGRIEIDLTRIKHIVVCLGYTFQDFENNLGKEETRDLLVDSCRNKISRLDDIKLELVNNLLKSL